jgi:hypothetical protein
VAELLYIGKPFYKNPERLLLGPTLRPIVKRLVNLVLTET